MNAAMEAKPAVKVVHFIGVIWMTLCNFASHIRSEWVQKRADIEVVLEQLMDLIINCSRTTSMSDRKSTRLNSVT